MEGGGECVVVARTSGGTVGRTNVMRIMKRVRALN